MKKYWIISILILTLLFSILPLGVVDIVNGEVIDPYIAAVAFPNLSFNQPTGIIADPANRNRLFVPEQGGTISFPKQSKRK